MATILKRAIFIHDTRSLYDDLLFSLHMKIDNDRHCGFFGVEQEIYKKKVHTSISHETENSYKPPLAHSSKLV